LTLVDPAFLLEEGFGGEGKEEASDEEDAAR
jgi:hypothetical protein